MDEYVERKPPLIHRSSHRRSLTMRRRGDGYPVFLFSSALWCALCLYHHPFYYYSSTTTMHSALPLVPPARFMTSTIEEEEEEEEAPMPFILPEHASSSSAAAASMTNQHIPRILIFTHYIPLLTANFTTKSTPAKNTSSAKDWDEWRVLQANVRRIIALHQEKEEAPVVRFLTDADCIDSIRQWARSSSRQPNHAPDSHDNNNDSEHEEENTHNALAEELIHYFLNEPVGMYKADLCRGVALYETGGIYCDVDLGVRTNLFSVLQQDTEFATIRVHAQSKYYPDAFFQAMIVATPRHPVLHRYVQLFLQYYRHATAATQVPGPLGVLLLARAYAEIQDEQLQALAASPSSPTTTTTNTNTNSGSTGVVVPTTTHLQKTTELWQEVLYVPEWEHTVLSQVPRPTWGHRRACRFVVVVPPSPPPSIDYETKEEEYRYTNHTTPPWVVPMYSRIAGSRMCPVDS